MTKLPILFLLLSLYRPAISAQQPPPSATFDTVSIRPSNPASKGFGYNPNPNSFQAKGVSLGFLIQLAYDANASDIIAIPVDLQSLKFDILAKADPDPASTSAPLRYSSEAGRQLFQVRLQAVLADRFHLRLHHATANRAVLNLQATSHLHLGPASTQNPMQTYGPGSLRFDSTDMDGLATALSAQLKTNVINRTGLSGTYKLEVKWDVQQEGEPLSYPFSSVSDALQEQLGLRLVRAKAGVPILVVDSAAAPSPN